MDLPANGETANQSAQSELLAAAARGAAPELVRQLMLQAAGTETAGDPLAAMLAVQMAAVHEAALRMLQGAGACGDATETQALYARQAARLLHLFQRQAKTLAQHREAARLEARAAEYARREEEERRRRQPPRYLFEDDEEDEDEDEEAGEEDIGGDHVDDDAAGGWAAAGKLDGAAGRATEVPGRRRGARSPG